MKILNFGSCNIDYVYTVPHFVRAGETLASAKLEKFPGGKGLNQSIAAARAGAEVLHVGAIGKDGLFLRDLLAQAGVDVSRLRIADGVTGHAIIQVDPAGQNCILLHGGVNFSLDCDYIDEVLAGALAEDIVLLQNETSHVAYMLDRAATLGLCVAWNPSPFSEELRSVDLGKISILLLNEVEGEALTGKKDPRAICDALHRKNPALRVVLTLGEKGAIYADERDYAVCPAFAVEAVDTTAAGDTFTGYYLAAIAKGVPAVNALRLASAASALAVSRPGAAVSIPAKDEVEAALPHLTPKEKTI